jgi:hypothetical protein
MCGQNVELLNVKADGTYSYHTALESQQIQSILGKVFMVQLPMDGTLQPVISWRLPHQISVCISYFAPLPMFNPSQFMVCVCLFNDAASSWVPIP